MGPYQLSIKCDIKNSNYFRIRISMLVSGIIFLFLSLQGFINIAKHNYTHSHNIKTYTIIFLFLALVLILSGSLTVQKINYTPLNI